MAAFHIDSKWIELHCCRKLFAAKAFHQVAIIKWRFLEFVLVVIKVIFSIIIFAVGWFAVDCFLEIVVQDGQRKVEEKQVQSTDPRFFFFLNPEG